MRAPGLPVVLAICGAALFAIAAVVHIGFDAGYEWPFIALAAAVASLAAGIAWERRLTADLWRENHDLQREAERHRDELAQARQQSSALQSEAALALRDSEALYHSLVDHLPLSVLRKDTAGVYTFVNRRFLEFSGKTAADIIGTTDFDQFPPELATRYRHGDGKVLAGIEFEDVEVYQKPGGDKRYIHVRKTPVRDATERIIGTQVMFWDVTDKHEAEEALARSARELEQRNADLQESEQNLQRQTGILMSILNSIADGVVVADENGRFVVWNPAADRIIGLGPMDKPTTAWPTTYGLYRSDKTTPFPADQLPLALAIRGETAIDVPLFVRNRSRPEGVLLSVTGTPLNDAEGRIKGGVAVFRDVTAQRAAESEIQSKNQDLETLLYVISHDLREPLRAIENFSKIVSERYAEHLDEKGKDFLSRVVRGAQRLDRLLADVLTLSRVQRTAQPEENVDAGEIVADVLRHLEPRIRETQARIHVCDGLPLIRADRRWATQAVQNLVSNALKYTAEGDVPDVEIGGFSGPEGLGLAVRDRGMGVPPEVAERIFQLFQRAVNRNIEGTGAGLAIVKRVAERHGGRAWVRPREGGGSEFIITFGSGTA